MGTGWKTNTGCEVLEVHWFTQVDEIFTTGMVLVQCKEYKVAYVGSAPGIDEKIDSVHIAQTASKLSKETAAAEFKNYDLSDYKGG